MVKWVDHGSGPVCYRDEGEGFPVVLLHGLAEDSGIWTLQTEFLQKDYRLIVPDLPGSGQSAILPGEGSIDQLAASVKAICDEAGVERCILIGHSMGGYVALAFAEKYPDRLSALGLFHSTAYGDPPEKISNRRKAIEFIGRNGAAAYVRQSLPDLFSEKSRREQPEILEELLDRYGGFEAAALIYYQEAMIGRPDRTKILRQFDGPVLFVIGQQDKAVPMEQSLKQCHLPGLSHVHIFENAGHMGMLEESSRSSQILKNFITFSLNSWQRSS